MKKLLYFLAIGATLSFTACGDTEATDKTDTNAVKEVVTEVVTEETPAVDSEALKTFIMAPQYGWKKADADYFYSFMTDGRLHIQGADGEATMWEGTWSLEGDMLTITHPEEPVKVVKIYAEGADLMIGADKYVVDTI